jgi:hypothetical protein
MGFSRLMYPPATFGRGFREFGDWSQGFSSWTIDYPRGDRHMAAAVKRLTRVEAWLFEQPVNLDDGDDVFHWPWLYAVEVGHWDLTDAQAHKLRDYLLRGGFLMVDDFHGTLEWQIFLGSIERVFPDRKIVDISGDDPIFHTLWDLEQRVFPVCNSSIPIALTKKTVTIQNGARFMTIRDASWWSSATTWIWAIPWNIQITLSIPKNIRRRACGYS